MNDEAANAFLKTLEEPPPGAVLILIGTSAELQLDTIVSRCQVVRFEPLPEPELAGLLLERGVAADPADAGPAGRPGRGSDEPGDRPGRPRPGAVPPRPDRRAGRRAWLRSRRSSSQRIEAFIKQAGKEAVDQRQAREPLSASWPGSSAASSGRPPALEPPCPDPADRQAAMALGRAARARGRLRPGRPLPRGRLPSAGATSTCPWSWSRSSTTLRR